MKRKPWDDDYEREEGGLDYGSELLWSSYATGGPMWSKETVAQLRLAIETHERALASGDPALMVKARDSAFTAGQYWCNLRHQEAAMFDLVPDTPGLGGWTVKPQILIGSLSGPMLGSFRAGHDSSVQTYELEFANSY